MVIRNNSRTTQGKSLRPNTPAKPSPQKGAFHGNVPSKPKPDKATVKPVVARSDRASQGSQSGSGGGARSKQVSMAGGSDMTRKVSVPQASQIGLSQGSHITDKGEAKRPNVPIFQPAQAPCCLGNEIAKNVGRGGPGVGRTVYATGSQGQQGPVNPGMPTQAPRSNDVMSNNRKD
jgi:hypothetical protein